ncbi:BON domain-containing protein [Neorhizobium sp. NPDC001467]|uniref:BON domain-containing protein n=1 Tax=Neorhizobium sp. NPDC001467 TaxID=3390595 RepID=UPI003D0042F9
MVFKPPMFNDQEPTIEVENPPAAELETRVADALATNFGVDASDVKVVASGSDITLTGTVLDAKEIERATEVAASVEGVSHVRNMIRSGGFLH